MFSRLFVALTFSMVLIAASLPQSAAHAMPAAIAVVANTTAPDSTNTKLPDIAGSSNQVYMTSTPGDYNSGGSVRVWQKKDSDGAVPNGTNIGDASGQADYRTSTVAVGPGGVTYVSWVDRDSNTSYISSKPANGSWSGRKKVVGGGSGRTAPDMAVSSSGAIFLIWSEGGKAIYRVSRDNGDSWSGGVAVYGDAPYRRVSVAAGPNGQVIAGYASNKGQIVVGIWNGSSFDSKVIASSGGFLADATVSIGGNGKFYAAWRSASGGIYYAERQPDGSWPSSRLAGGQAFGVVAINADPAGNIHIGWSSDLSSKWDLYYAYKPVNSDWQGPQRVAFGVTLANPAITATISDATYGHVAVERFSGGNPSLTYVLFKSGASTIPPVIDGTPQIEGNAQFSNKTTVNVSLTNVNGKPTQVRYHWGAAPTDADAWIDLANGTTFQANVPADAGTTSCTPLTLYTQVSDGKTVQSGTRTASITIDRAVQASVMASNPNIASLATVYTPLSTNDSSVENGGATDGDPNYTRVRQFFLGVNNSGDCSGLKTVVAGAFTAAVPEGGFSNAIPLPGDPTVGPKNISIVVTDNAGNTLNITKVITYDTGDTDPSPTVNNTAGLPVLQQGGTVAGDGTNSVLQTLTFSNIRVTDNLYDIDNDRSNDNSYWGVWIANSRTDVGAEDPNLNWYPVRVSHTDPNFSLKWSLFSGLNYGTAADKTGDYYTYVRFLDGAGNPSVAALKLKTTLQSGYTFPSLSLPFIAR
jgi:hypothetical protein